METTTPETIIAILKIHKNELEERFQVESLAIFGSVSRGTAGPMSDVDILVRYRQTPGFFGFLDLKNYLEILIGRRVDLVTEPAIKKEFRAKILQEAINVS